MVQEKVQQLLSQGFCRFEQILSHNLLERLRQATNRLLDLQPAELQQRFRSQGSMISMPKTDDAVFADLIAWPPALAALAALGFPQPTYTDGYIISKPPHSPALFWHYDWFAWGDPSAYAATPPQLFFMYYLTDTRRENGCLRVIPGSHRQHNPLHDLLAEPHSEELARGQNQDRAEFATRPDEIDVPVQAGDLLIGDARVLHASHANTSDQRRTLLTLWYQPDFANLPDRVKAQMVKKTQPLPEGWGAAAQAKVARLHPHYSGDAEPYGRILYQPQPR